MYVKVNNDVVETYPYTIGDLRRDNPNTSFPRYPSSEMLASWGVYPVVEVTPEYNPLEEYVTSNGIVPVLDNGVWIATLAVVQRTESQRRAAYATQMKKEAGESLTSSGLSNSELGILSSAYSEVCRYLIDSGPPTPIIDAIHGEFPGLTKVQVGTKVKNRYESYITGAAAALARNIKRQEQIN